MFVGERGFLIGGGPSIKDLMANDFDFKRLEQLSSIVVGVNKAYKLLNPNLLVYQDDYIWDAFKDELMQLPLTTTITCPHYCRGSNNTRVIPFRAAVSVANLPDSFSIPIGTKNNAGVTALRICYILGLNPIYLVGIDLRAEDCHPDRFNFHTDYDSERQSMVTPDKVGRFRKYFIETIEELNSRGVSVYSCSKISTLNAHIPYVDIQTISDL